MDTPASTANAAGPEWSSAPAATAAGRLFTVAATAAATTVTASSAHTEPDGSRTAERPAMSGGDCRALLPAR